MSTAAAGIYELLSENTGLTAYVSDRIYPINLPDELTYPAVIYSQLSEQEDLTKDGPVNAGYAFAVDVFAATPALCNAIAIAVKSALNWRSVEVDGLGALRFRFDDQVDATWDDEKELYHKVLDFRARKI